MSVLAIVKLRAKPGLRDSLLEVIGPAVATTREQPACTSIELVCGIENAEEVLLLERWQSVQDHEDFINGVIASGGLDEIMGLLAADIETFHYR